MRRQEEGDRSHCWRWHDDRRTISGEQRVGNSPPTYRKQGAGGSGRHPETPTSGYCLSYPVVPPSRSLWHEGISAYTRNSRRVCVRVTYACTYNKTLITYTELITRGWKLAEGFALLRNIFSFTPPLPPLLSFFCRTVSRRVPSRLRILDSVFAVTLNGGENRSNVNARETFTILMKTLFSNII